MPNEWAGDMYNMGKIKGHQSGFRADYETKKKSEAGFSYVETIISMIILSVGLLAALSAMMFAVSYAKVSEKRTNAKEIAGSMIENIFAIRDIQTQGELSISGWDAVQIKKSDNTGIFIGGWFPVRDSPGDDGIYGTADDSCQVGGNCTTAAVTPGYERNIEITDVVENGVVRKRIINVIVRYQSIGGIYRQESISTLIANLPIN